MVSPKAASASLAAVNGGCSGIDNHYACMQDLNPAPFRGDAKIPHVNEDFFKMFFVGANVRAMRHPPPPPPAACILLADFWFCVPLWLLFGCT